MNKFLFLICLLSLTEQIIQDAIYNIIIDNKNYLNYQNNILQISSSNKFEEKSNFRISRISNLFYNIVHVESNLKLSLSSTGILLFQKSIADKQLLTEWIFIKTNDNKYVIQNINKCYMVYKNKDFSCKNVAIREATRFNLIKIYEEVKQSEEDLELIEKEQIDVLIKYIDLSDPLLKREGIPQIKKDENNK